MPDRVGHRVQSFPSWPPPRNFGLRLASDPCYLTRNAAERGQLLKSVLLNRSTDGANLSPTYRKPFDLIFQHAKTENWSGREDLDLCPPAPSRCPDSTDIAPLHWYQSRWENAEENYVTKLPTVRLFGILKRPYLIENNGRGERI